MNDYVTMEKIVSLAKRRGFVFQANELYGGLAGFYDLGPLGSLLNNNIKESWLNKFVHSRQDMFLVDAAIVMSEPALTASGHVGGFSDPLVECEKCHKRFREDTLEEDTCPECGGSFGEVKQFNLMLKTSIGAVEDSSSVAYLRPETAQGIFLNYKNVMDSMHPKVPFGVAQIGKAYRNEITPRDFIFRVREFEQMEIEYFIHPSDWETYFEYWKDEMYEWMKQVGISLDRLHQIEVTGDDLAHYSKRTIDFEFDFPFGQKELFGLAYRTDYDLTKHAEHSKQKLQYTDPETNETYVPHVIEPTHGLGRAMLAILVSAYREDEVDGEIRVFLDLKPSIAPYKIAVSPLLKNKPELVEKAREVFGKLKAAFGNVVWDDNGNIGKRYRRQDEIGTPYCVVVDFETLEGDTAGTVTVRDRNTTEQTRVAIDELYEYFTNNFA